MRIGLRARVPSSRASHTAADARFALTEGRLSTTAVNLTQIDSLLRHKRASGACRLRASALIKTVVRAGHRRWSQNRRTPPTAGSRAAPIAQTQRFGSLEPRQPRDDRILGKRPSDRAPSWRCLWRHPRRQPSSRPSCALPRQQPSRRARRTTGSPRLSGSHAARGRRHPPRYCFVYGVGCPSAQSDGPASAARVTGLRGMGSCRRRAGRFLSLCDHPPSK